MQKCLVHFSRTFCYSLIYNLKTYILWYPATHLWYNYVKQADKLCVWHPPRVPSLIFTLPWATMPGVFIFPRSMHSSARNNRAIKGTHLPLMKWELLCPVLYGMSFRKLSINFVWYNGSKDGRGEFIAEECQRCANYGARARASECWSHTWTRKIQKMCFKGRPAFCIQVHTHRVMT